MFFTLIFLVFFFSSVLTFSGPPFTHYFVMSLALNHFIFNCINMVNIIHKHQALGAHTDIIIFKLIITYKWTPPGACPMENDAPFLSSAQAVIASVPKLPLGGYI